MNFDPNPLYFKMVEIYSQNKNDNNKVIIGNAGGTRCFSKETKVLTSKGYKPISDIKPKDLVLTYNEQTKNKEYKLVNKSLKFNNTKKTIEVTLQSGKKFRATEDHEFYYKGAWHSLKDLLSLWDERNMETTTVNA